MDEVESIYHQIAILGGQNYEFFTKSLRISTNTLHLSKIFTLSLHCRLKFILYPSIKMSIPPIIYDIIRWVTALMMLGGIVSGSLMSWLIFLRRIKTNPWVNILFALLLAAMSLTLMDKFFNFTSISRRYPNWTFLPIYLSFSFAPLLFYYVKSRLYPHFAMHRRDFKHFILPTAQFAILAWVTLQDATSKNHFKSDFFSPFYGNFEKGVFIVQFFLYIYFSYRFILHEKHPLSIEAQKRKNIGQKATFRRQVLVVSWLKRMVKVLFILFGIHTFFLLTDYFSYKFFNINLQTKALFSAFYELSFVAMLFWLFLNGFFAWRRGL